MKKVDIYTDGACSGNPGPGGWAAVMVYRGIEKEMSGGEPKTTNNRMELTAVIRALSALKEACDVTVYTDSKYIADSVNLGWARSWKRKNWIKSDKKPALNPDLWEELLSLSEKHNLKVVWVRGHDGHEYNERCDRLAVAQSEKFKNSHI
ncbi:MAG: ribonuclease HI [Eubacteriales bacterium]|nr:ribonuclease HI [Eubacteriales bacterium]